MAKTTQLTHPCCEFTFDIQSGDTKFRFWINTDDILADPSDAWANAQSYVSSLPELMHGDYGNACKDAPNHIPNLNAIQVKDDEFGCMMYFVEF